MNITAEQVAKLNKRISDLNAEGTKVRARLEVLEGNLQQALADYERTYGVTLSGKSAKETARLIEAELKSVSKEVQEEYDLRMRVVDAIERGDIDEANRLLGVEVPEEVDDQDEVAEETVIEEADSVVSDEEDFVDEDLSDEEGDDAYRDLDGDGLLGEDDDTSINSFTLGGDFGDLVFEDDDSADNPPPVPQAPTSAPAKAPKPTKKAAPPASTPASAVVSAMEGGEGFVDFIIDDDEVDTFGFGSMLAGTKFGDD